jgi:acylphosphatase
MILMESSASQRRHVFYSGHVQGVGFRYTTSQIARGYQVTGFVRNLPDGRVELVAESDKQQLKAFLAEIQDRMAQFIRQAAVAERPATGEFQDFEIRH